MAKNDPQPFLQWHSFSGTFHSVIDRLGQDSFRRLTIQSGIFRLSDRPPKKLIESLPNDGIYLTPFFDTTRMFGVLNLYKPSGCTSRDCINQLQKRLRRIKLGHAGTLDPMANGVLLVAVGPAARIIEYFQQLPKTYVAEFRLGCRSDSLDTESIVEFLPAPYPVELHQLRTVIDDFVGVIRQRPPQYSAIKIQGRRAYRLVRQGTIVEMPERRVHIHRIECTDFSEHSFTISVQCDSGTYIRTLGNDIAERCGSSAVMTRLSRTAIGPCAIGEALDLEQPIRYRAILDRMLNPAELLTHMPLMTASDESIARLRNGIFVLEKELTAIRLELDRHYPSLLVDQKGQLRAVLTHRGDDLWGAERNFDQES